MAKKRVLSVGQCAADHAQIRWMLASHFDAEVTPADNATEALAALKEAPVQLVLINRILDADGSSGLDVLRQVKADSVGRDVPAMLITNYEEWQQRAVEAGAAPGFGKGALGDPATVERLKRFLSEPVA